VPSRSRENQESDCRSAPRPPCRHWGTRRTGQRCIHLGHMSSEGRRRTVGGRRAEARHAYLNRNISRPRRIDTLSWHRSPPSRPDETGERSPAQWPDIAKPLGGSGISLESVASFASQSAADIKSECLADGMRRATPSTALPLAEAMKRGKQDPTQMHADQKGCTQMVLSSRSAGAILHHDAPAVHPIAPEALANALPSRRAAASAEKFVVRPEW
jgi:hypothetical protein